MSYAELVGLGVELGTRFLTECLARQTKRQRVGLDRQVGAVVVDICAADGLVLLDKVPYLGGEPVLADDVVRTEETRHKHHQNKQAVAHALTPRVRFGFFGLGVAEELNGDERSQSDEYAVDEEQVQRAAGIVPVPVGYAVAHGAERWHQRRCDGYAGDDCAFLLARQFEYACHAAEESYHHIVD